MFSLVGFAMYTRVVLPLWLSTKERVNHGVYESSVQPAGWGPGV